MTSESAETTELLRRVGQGDRNALGELFSRHRERLRSMVELRLDRRLQGRIDPSDVLQEAYLEVSRSIEDYLRKPDLPFFLWVRLITGVKLLALHRHHLGVKSRDARREVSLYRGALPEASSVSLAAQLLGRLTSPSHVAMRAELQIRIQQALNSMDVVDREILALRHFEQLSNSEAAQVLGLSETAASNRFVRALKRLKALLSSEPGLLDEPKR
ncbi:MAG TPA: sigma-70 family RNA polymerase sigma factor [Gemmataceae bacterium]|nr:sigma-70 family RNA polymerase sigma factor [Gemmataceae bacterium]